jgi:hypothetical protein
MCAVVHQSVVQQVYQVACVAAELSKACGGGTWLVVQTGCRLCVGVGPVVELSMASGVLGNSYVR